MTAVWTGDGKMTHKTRKSTINLTLQLKCVYVIFKSMEQTQAHSSKSGVCNVSEEQLDLLHKNINLALPVCEGFHRKSSAQWLDVSSVINQSWGGHCCLCLDLNLKPLCPRQDWDLKKNTCLKNNTSLENHKATHPEHIAMWYKRSALLLTQTG